jgi:hypothetical protein
VEKDSPGVRERSYRKASERRAEILSRGIELFASGSSARASPNGSAGSNAPARSAAGLFAGQVLMGGVWGIFAALGIIVAQRLLPTAVATASAVFLSATALASALGGAAGGLGAAVVGLPVVFFIPAALALLAVVGLAAMTRSAGRNL